MYFIIHLCFNISSSQDDRLMTMLQAIDKSKNIDYHLDGFSGGVLNHLALLANFGRKKKEGSLKKRWNNARQKKCLRFFRVSERVVGEKTDI